MADRYFDRNGATAGFGTLTGAWDTTTASWSTSSAGTATPTAYTFTNADTAIFGAPPTTATAGTATISNGITVTLNKLQINMSGQQTVTGSGTGNLTFAGSTPSIVSLGAGQPIISAPINFASGLTFQPGSNALVLSGTGQNGNSGTVTISNGTVYMLNSGASGTPDQIKGATAISLTETSVFTSAQYWGANAYTEPASLTASFITGAGNVGVFCHNNAGVTLSHSSVGTFTGSFGASAYTTNTLTGRLVLNTAPVSCGFLYVQSIHSTSQSGVAPVIVFNHSGAATIAAPIQFYAGQASTSLAAVNYCLEQNSATLTTFSGNVSSQTGSNASAFQWIRLTGTGVSAITGNIAQSLGITGVRKLGTGQWDLSGANTYTGSTLIEAGTLIASSSSALGATSASGTTTISGTGVLKISAGITLNKSLTDFTITNTSNPIQTSGGTATFQPKAMSLASSATTTFDVSSGDNLVLSPQNAGVISGSGAGITKAGAGTLTLAAVANTFTGAVTISAGTLSIGSVADAGIEAAWGTGSLSPIVELTSTLKYTGATGSSSRTVRCNGSAPTIDASGSGALTLSSLSQDTTAKTITLTGTNTDANTLSSNIANNTGTTGLAKAGAGKWVLSGALSYTGTTAVAGTGTLRVQTTNSNTTSGAVTIASGSTVELVTDTLASTSSSSGEVLGTGNVTVNGGSIKTRGGTTQKGQVRYGGNLTFGAGSTLYIGAAA